MHPIAVRALTFLLTTSVAMAASAATITVNNLTDTANASTCRLRDAIQAANADAVVNGCTAGSGADTILLDKYSHSITAGELSVTSTITISGIDRSLTIIDAGSTSRIFNVAAAGSLTLSRVTLQNGVTASYGGAANISGVLNASNVTIKSCSQGGGTNTTGGALYYASGSQGTITDTLLQSNFSNFYGGAIGIAGATVTLRRIEAYQNTTSGYAAAVDTSGTATVVIDQSLFRNNSAPSRGGALMVRGGTTTVTNTTFSGNTSGYAGAISAWGGTTRLSHVTIVDNIAQLGAGGLHADGGTVYVNNTLVARNHAPSGGNCLGAAAGEDHNLVDEASSCSMFVHATDKVGVDPLIGTPGANGGYLNSVAVPLSSPAVGAGSCLDTTGVAVSVDQRGVARTAASCTIGAYEYRDAKAFVSVVTEPAGANCATGGYALKSGLDFNGNGTLDATEVSSTNYLCAGLNTLQPRFNVVDEAAGANCAAGGKKLESGLDTNSNSSLDSNEVTSTSYVCNGEAGSNGRNTLLAVTNEAAGANCATGGKKMSSGLDTNGNNTLDAGEVTSTAYTCNGANGADGVSSLVSVTAEGAGANCPTGGRKIRSGLDANKNNTLDSNEVSATNYVCNGTNGTNGTNGQSSLVTVTDEARGPNCTAGGQRVDTGLDTDSSGNLDQSEVTWTSYVCNGVDGATGADGLPSLIATSDTPFAPGCQTNATKIESGLDLDRNGVLDPNEVTSTAYVCNGVNGNAGAGSLIVVSAEPPGSNCPYGGRRLDSGVDQDLDGLLKENEVSTTSFVCDGAPGKSALVTTTSEPAGSNCPTGGQRVDAGVDSNGNGVLDLEEITSSEYVCNGAARTSLVNAITLNAGDAQCPAGGLRIETGVDDSNDGVLSSDEVDHSSVICNGVAATAAKSGCSSTGLSSLSMLLTLLAVLATRRRAC